MTVRIMSFNLRVAGRTVDGENRFEKRAPLIAKLLREESPDLIGFQEATDLSRACLEDLLCRDYLLLGCGRDSDCRGEGCTVAVKREKFALLSFETLWLSETPEVPGSCLTDSDQSKCPRLAHLLLLRPYGRGGNFRFVNTHLDHVGDEARRRELAILSPHLLANDLPAALTGDFNACPDSATIRGFEEKMKPHGWHDATEGTGGTFHAYGKCERLTKIDYIYTNCRSENSRVLVREPVDGVYYSDHYAVVTDLIL